MTMRAAGVLVLAGLWLTSGQARAQASAHRLQLRYSAPPECADSLELVRVVEQFLGQSLGEAGEQALAIDVRTQGDAASGYSAKLSFIAAQGQQERFLEHPDCSKLSEAAALLVAIAIDPERVNARQRASADAAPAQPAVAVQPETVEPAPAQPSLPALQQPMTRDTGTEPRRAVRAGNSDARLSIALMGLAGSGLLPSVAPGFGAELALRFGAFEAGLGGRYWISRSAAVPDAPRTTVDMSLLTAGLRLCGVPGFGDWVLPLCARAELGDLQGTGEGVNNARPRSALFGALGGSLALGYARHRLMPFAGLDLQWLASQPRFGVRRAGQEVEAFQPDALALGGFLGLAYRL